MAVVSLCSQNMFPSPLTIGSETFERQKDGQYINTASTIDQPDLWIVQNRNLFPNNGDPALITVKNSYSKNSTTTGIISDDVLEIWTTMKLIPGRFSQAELEAKWGRFPTFFSSANFTRLLRAEI